MFKYATTLSWFVITSTGENFGLQEIKTYYVLIKFYIPAPYSIDPLNIYSSSNSSNSKTEADFEMLDYLQHNYHDSGVVGVISSTADNNNNNADGATNNNNGTVVEDKCRSSSSSSTETSQQLSTASEFIKRKRHWVSMTLCIT